MYVCERGPVGCHCARSVAVRRFTLAAAAAVMVPLSIYYVRA